MADKTQTVSELKIENLFVDGDTRIMTLKNPKTTITTEQVRNLETLILNGGGSNTLLIGDKYGGDFRRIEVVKKIDTTTITLDLS